jgi:hypothetical protein
MKITKPVKTTSKKFEIFEIIKAKHHVHRSGDFLHYATILPSGKDPDWWEKGGIWHERVK